MARVGSFCNFVLARLCPKKHDPTIEDSYRSTKEIDGNHVTFELLEHISHGKRATFGHRDRGTDADGVVWCKLDAAPNFKWWLQHMCLLETQAK